MPFRVTWRYEDKYCKKCHNYDEKYRDYIFCSEKCMGKWVKKFVGHKCDWVKNPMSCVQEDGSYGELCVVCGDRRVNNGSN